MRARSVAGMISVLGLAVSACTSHTNVAPTQRDGWLVYSTDRAEQTIVCTDVPVRLAGSRTDLTLHGPCRSVQITGDHNDIAIDIVPAGVIEIKGSHNDVSWKQAFPGPKPSLLDNGQSNTFHILAP